MKKRLCTFFLFILSLKLIQAQQKQDYIFRVMVSSGTNEIKKANKWVALRTGNKLNLSDEIQIEAGSFLGLAHKSGKTVELKNPGKYKINELASKISLAGTSAMQKYADFVVAQMTKDSEKSLDKRKQTTGATERALNKGIKAFLPHNVTCNVFEGKTSIAWYPSVGTKEYSVIIKNFSDEVLLKKIAKDTFLIIDFADAAFNTDKLNDNNFNIVIKSITTPGKSSGDGYGFHKMSKEEKSSVDKEINAITPNINESSSLQKIMIASFYEDKKLYLEVDKKYKEAILLEPKVNEYKILYKDFLERYDMGRPKK